MIDLGALQDIANGFMLTPVVIRHKLDPAKDPSDRTGDNVVSFHPVTTTVEGWFVDRGTPSFSGGRMVEITDRPTLRVPIGTVVDTGDEVTIGGKVWIVTDASDDETWAIWIKVGLTRIE